MATEILVPDAETVWKGLSQEEKKKVNHGKAVPIGQYRKDGWLDEHEFFILKCPDCGGLLVDYRQGYGGGHFWCRRCERSIFTCKA